MSVPAERNGGWDFSAIGLKLRDPDLPFEDFEQLCWMLGRFHEAVRFAIGDALNVGPELYGDECYQAFEVMNLSEDARMEYGRVARQVPYSVRRKGLSWSHHRAVASLKITTASGEVVPDRKAQKEWLKRAADENMSHHVLREELRDSGISGVPSAGPAIRQCRCCGQTLQ